MKKILYILIIIFIIIISSCSSPTGNITDINKYEGKYQANLITLQKRALTITIANDGSFEMSYENTNATTSTPQGFSVAATNVVGADPNYSFQNLQGVGTLKFTDTNKVIVTFRKLIPDYYTIGETLCIRTQ